MDSLHLLKPGGKVAEGLGQAGGGGTMNPWLSRRVFGWAHQGGADEGPANTIEAMRQAMDRGIHGLEFDVHQTADQQLVLHHDSVVADGGTKLEIAETSLARLREAKPNLATLDEVLAAFPGVPLTVEVKSPGAAKPTARKLADEPGDRQVIVSSFSPSIVSAIEREAPSLPTAPAWPAILAFWTLSRLSIPPPVGSRHVALQVSLRLDQVSVAKRVPIIRNRRLADKRLVIAAHRRGLAVHVWTLDERAEIEEALAAGADGIMTDRPTELMRILNERGVRWPG